MGLLRDFLPRHTYAVVGALGDQKLEVTVAAARIGDEDELLLQFPQRNPYQVGERVVVQLDNRMDVARLTDQLPVHRTSYKGTVVAADEASAGIAPDQFQIFHSFHMVAEFRRPGWTFPPDPRPAVGIKASALTTVPTMREDEAGAHLGVLVTWAADRPHSTVMAFLSTVAGDLFLVTDPKSFKAHNLFRDPRAVFAIDFRATYDLDKPLTWAYRIQPFQVRYVPRTSPGFAAVQGRFLEKNPWEGAFFTDPTSALLHLTPV